MLTIELAGRFIKCVCENDTSISIRELQQQIEKTTVNIIRRNLTSYYFH